MRRPNVVLDTNVIVSAHLNEEGLERFVLDLALARKIQLFLSAKILEEYEGVLARPAFKLAPGRVSAALRSIEEAAILLHPDKSVQAAKDPDDDKFLECAAEAKADYLVTGNKKHFPEQWQQTRIVNAREFLQETTPELQR